MSYRSEFPDFGTLDVSIPSGFKDQSYRNDVCPKFASDARGLVIWVDYKNRSKREWPDSKRFSVSTWTKDGDVGERPLLETDSWPTVLYSLNTIENMRRKNPSGPAITYRVIAHGKNGEVAYRGRELHLSYGAAEAEAKIVSRRGGLTDVHIVKNGKRIVGEVKARKNPARAHDLVDIVSILNGTVLESRIFRYIAEQNAWLFRHDGNKVKIVPHRSVRRTGSGRSTTRRNPVKTFFCFPCGRKFISTTRASEANCPDCRRVCQATRLKSRSNPSRGDEKMVWRTLTDRDGYHTYIYVPKYVTGYQSHRRPGGAHASDYGVWIDEEAYGGYIVKDGHEEVARFLRLPEAKKFVENKVRRSNPRRRARRGR